MKSLFTKQNLRDIEFSEDRYCHFRTNSFVVHKHLNQFVDFFDITYSKLTNLVENANHSNPFSHPTLPTNSCRYSILCAKKIKAPITPEKATKVILEHQEVDPEKFRFGETKVLKRSDYITSTKHHLYILPIFACFTDKIFISFQFQAY